MTSLITQRWHWRLTSLDKHFQLSKLRVKMKCRPVDANQIYILSILDGPVARPAHPALRLLPPTFKENHWPIDWYRCENLPDFHLQYQLLPVFLGEPYQYPSGLLLNIYVHPLYKDAEVWPNEQNYFWYYPTFISIIQNSWYVPSLGYDLDMS